MAFAGLRKQINKANQYVTEKMGGAEGTKLDLDFMEMERKTDVTCELVEELQTKTKEFLQPNPTARAKMAAVKGISKLSGQAKSNTYPQPEGVLGECMLTYGKKLGEDTVFSNCLIEMGEAMKQMADVKYSLDDNIKQNFLEPLHHLQTKDLKEVMHHRKKLQGRRLDFDCKRRRQAKDEEIKQAEEKFAESLQLAQIGMFNLLDNDVEQVAQLTFFAEGLLEYHQQCTEILKVLVEDLQKRQEEAASLPKMEFVPKTLSDLHIEGVTSDGVNNGRRPGFGSAQNLSTGLTPSNNLKHSSSIGNLSSRSNFSVGPHTNNNHARQNGASVNSSSALNGRGARDPFNMWDASDSAGGGPQFARPAARAAVHRPFPAPRTATQAPPTYLDPWAGGSAASSPVHKPPSNLELYPAGAQPQRSNNASPLPSPVKTPAKSPMVGSKPCCTALYDFEPENQGELGFKENDIITLINKIDENWYEGSVNGRTGYFPVSYVQVNVPLPNM